MSFFTPSPVHGTNPGVSSRVGVPSRIRPAGVVVAVTDLVPTCGDRTRGHSPRVKPPCQRTSSYVRFRRHPVPRLDVGHCRTRSPVPGVKK